MALRMDSGIHHAPTHHRTALPKRSSPPEADRLAPRKAAPPSTGSGRSPVVSTRRKGGQESSEGSSKTGSRNGGGAATAGSVASSAGEAAGGGSPGKTVAGPRESAKRSGGGSSGSGSDGGGGNSGSGGDIMYSTARKRVRIADATLGEFAVILQPYNGDHNDICEVCDKGGPLLCCDFCNLVYHLNCAKLSKEPSEELWICPACTTEVTARQISKRRRMAEDGSRGTSPGPGLPGYERPTLYHGVKAENDAFRAFIMYKNQSVDIGLYPAAEDAARAYDRKALSLFGDAAVCNFPADEQVEVEGVGADGNTVKGVVRSFHQWRAEMQWGNKKRHLGFFERLDHASYAYNRAALYMNGPDTPLNPIKEGYIGPSLTGLPVRVPRNKLFVQQLPLPLASIAQARGTDQEGLQLARRRRQMVGQYHAPLVGDNHQVSFLPPLPPPSRPGLQPLRAMTPVVESTSPAKNAAPLEEEQAGVTVDTVDSGIAASNGIGESVSKLEDNVNGSSIQSVTDASGRKDDAQLTAAALAPSGIGSAEVAENAGILSPAPPSPPRLWMPSRPVAVHACPGVMIRDLAGNPQGTDNSSSPGSSACAACGDTAEAREASPKTDSENTLTSVGPETPDTTTSSEAATPSPAETPPVTATIKDEYGEPRRTGTPMASLTGSDCSVEAGQDPTTAARGAAMSANAMLPSMDPYFEADDITHFGTLSATAETADGTCPPSADEAESTCIDTKNVLPLSRSQPDSATEAPEKKSFEVGTILSSEAGDDRKSQSDLQASGTDAAEDNERVALQAAAAASVTPSQESSPAVLECAPIQMQNGISANVSFSGATVRKSTSSLCASHSSAENRNACTIDDVKKTETDNTSSRSSCRVEVGRSVTIPWSSPVHATELGAGRRRNRCPATPTTPKGSLSPSRCGGSGDSCSTNEGNAGGVAGPAIGIVSPDLSLDDLAELVWHPRAGARPRGLEPPSAAQIRAGRIGAVGQENDDATRDRVARLEKAVWDRDSALLEKVAPAHMEKAMQVIHTCRHDVERAAQMLTVRLGIQVEGLGIRQTRNSRMGKKQQASHCSRKPSPIGTGLAWRGNGVSAGAPGGGSDGSGACGGASGGNGAGASTAGDAATGRGVVGGSRKADAQGFTREETKMAGDTFMRYGRDLNAVTKVLGWKKGRVVEHYYCIWKYSPAYQVWKATRHQAGLPGVAGGSQYLNQAGSTSSGAPLGGGLLNTSSDGMRWRGSRLRTLKTGSSQ